MFNSIALDVVIGLLVIYLLYSLMVTVVSEMIATLLGWRAKNLRAAIARMLDAKPTDSLIDRFFNSPEIKHTGSSGSHRNPSSIRPESFSKALVEVLFGEKNRKELKTGLLEPETAVFLQNLWTDANNEIAPFRLLLEDWFNRTMDQASEWYKKKIQGILLIIGFCLAWFFCADTFLIVRNLSENKQARDQLAAWASAYTHQASATQDTSLMNIQKRLNTDLAESNAILGLGGWLPEKVRVTLDPLTKEKVYYPPLDSRCLGAADKQIPGGILTFTFAERLSYFVKLAYYHFFGFLVTALAVSLGAPFWFDLLNRVMRLRTSIKIKTEKGT